METAQSFITRAYCKYNNAVKTKWKRKYKTLFFTKFNSKVQNIDICNMYPNSLNMFYEESYLKFLSETLCMAQCSKMEP